MTVGHLPLRVAGLLSGAALILSGCGGDKTPPAKAPPEVGFVVAQQSRVPLVTELAGRTTAYESSEVRPQVSGLIRRRYFVEGSLVKKGQPLYQIDPSLYRASTEQAQANLASAAANAEATRIKADRYKPLADMQAVAKQDYTDAASAARQAAAAVQQTKAALDTARINLNYTTVPAPITGRIGRSLFTEGALVTASQTDPLTTIQKLDPIYVDIQEASADLLRLRRALSSGGAVATRADVRLKLEDGSDYGLVGDVEFSEVVVDSSTGTVTLRARFANPQGLLLPGMFVRASFAQSIDPDAFLIPQQAVTRDPKGQASVLVVGPDGKGGYKAVQRNISATQTQGTSWIVTDGLKAGDKIITQGVGKVKVGQAIRPVDATRPQTLKIPPPSAKSGDASSKSKN